MQDLDSDIRLLFATDVYGMGTDGPDVRHIVHVGPPTSLEGKTTELQPTLNLVRAPCQ